jgi:type III secretion protein L
MVIWLKGSASQMGVEDGVLRAADVQTLLSINALRKQLGEQQQTLLDAARLQAEAIVAEAEQQAQALRDGMSAQVEAAVQAGFDEGRKRNALEWHELQARQALNKSQALQRMHEKLALIVTSAVERIVHTEQRDALYQRALRNVQALTRGATQLTLRVGQADLDAATRGVAEARQHAPDGIRLEVAVDASLKPGSCIFESELGILDASLETQLDALRAAMRRAVHKALADSPEEAPSLFDPEADPDDAPALPEHLASAPPSESAVRSAASA